MRLNRPEVRRVLRRALPIALAVLVVGAATLRAWVSDDAYLTFRTIDNFSHGLGLRWNALERVQVYSDPLWMFLMLGLHALTREFYFSSIALSLALSAAAVGIVGFRLTRTTEQATLAVAMLLVSRAFLDYSTSGLENPLTHLLLGLLLWCGLEDNRATSGDVLKVTLIAALLGTTRLDLLLLVAPLVAWRTASRPIRSAWGAVAAGALPLVGWEVFSLFYYGFLFPNTAYAKLATGLPRLEMIGHGLHYLLNSLRLDPPTLPIIAAGIVAAFKSRRGADRAAGLGIVLYLVYVVSVGGDFMSGRFLTAPLLVAVVLVARSTLSGTAALRLACAGVVVFSLLPWTSPFRPAPDCLEDVEFGCVDASGIADERGVHEGTAALWNFPADGPWPNPGSFKQAGEIKSYWTNHTWITNLQFLGLVDPDEFSPFLAPGPVTSSPYRPTIVRAAVGVLGYYLGPEIHIVDYVALGDPFLARIPAVRRDPLLPLSVPRLSGLSYRVGHYARRLPLGYYETLTRGVNTIHDPDLAAWYDHLATITRAPLWDRERLMTIARMNLGRYDRLLHDGLVREAARRASSSKPGAP